MILIAKSDGTLSAVTGDAVNQGSANVNEIYFLAPLVASAVVFAAFTLPNGVMLTPRLTLGAGGSALDVGQYGGGEYGYTLTPVPELSGMFTDGTGAYYNAWHISLDAPLAQYGGNLSVQLVGVIGMSVHAYPKAIIHINEGVPYIEPDISAADVSQMSSWLSAAETAAAAAEDSANAAADSRSIVAEAVHTATQAAQRAMTSEENALSSKNNAEAAATAAEDSAEQASSSAAQAADSAEQAATSAEQAGNTVRDLAVLLNPGKDGGVNKTQTIDSDIRVLGSLFVDGQYTVINTEALTVENRYIVCNSNGVNNVSSGLIMITGPVIPGTDIRTYSPAYAILYDETSDTVRVGQGVYYVYNDTPTDIYTAGFVFGKLEVDGSGVGEIVEDTAQGQALATRANTIVNGNIPEWDAENNMFVDSGVSLGDISTALDSILAQQEAIIAMQNSLIGGSTV